MSKVVLGLVLGGVLGVFDGLSALVSAPNDPAVKAGIVGIVIGSTVKGLLTGALIGWFAKRAKSLGHAIVFGLAVGLALAFWCRWRRRWPDSRATTGRSCCPAGSSA